MTPEQRIRLSIVSERMAEVVLRDADPDNWIGGDKVPAELTKEERGDATWCRKMATQSVALLVRLEQLATVQGVGEFVDDPEADIRRAEARAADLLSRVARRGAKQET